MQNQVDWLIVGAGPAGLQLGYFLEKNGIDYLILEKNTSAGSFFKKFPRHKLLISINKVYTGFDDPKLNLRWDWNSLLSDDGKLLFKEYSQQYFPPRASMVQYLKDYAKQHHLKIHYKQKIISISKDYHFKVKTDSGDIYLCKKLFIATGVSLPYIPNIPGILFAKNYVNMSMDPRHYINKRVLIIGKGNSALETANHLLEVCSVIHIASPNPPRMAWRTHFVGHVRAINNHFLESYQLKSQNAVVNANIDQIQYKDNQYLVDFCYSLANGEVETVAYDEVIVCTGFKFDDSIFDAGCKPQLAIDDRFIDLTSKYESVNIKNMYCIGALMQMRDYKKKQSAFIHGFRYNIAFLFKQLLAEQNGASYPHLQFKDDPAELVKHIIQRVNQTTSLWQQTGYLADVLVYQSERKDFRYYAGVPVDFIKEADFAQKHHIFIITLEFGQERIDQYQNVFAIDRVHRGDYKRAYLSLGIHPIVRHYFNGHLLSEHHVLENFESVWQEPVHHDPLLEYLNNELAPLRMERAIEQKES